MKKKARLSGAGCKLKSEGIDDQVYQWIVQETQKHRITRKLIQQKVRELFDELAQSGAAKRDNLVASNGWLEKFMQRRSLSLRQTTTVCPEAASRFHSKISQLCDVHLEG